MLKLNFKLAIVILTVALFAVSCEKETEMVKTEPAETYSVDEKLLAFQRQIKSGNKNGESLKIQDAIWHIEGLLNRNLARQTEEVRSVAEIITDKYEISIDIENGQVAFSDVVNAFNDFENHAQAFSSDKADEKITLIDVALEEEKMVLSILSGKTGVKWHFGATDYWHSSYQLGKCGDYSGQSAGKDAATVIGALANTKLPHPAGNGYYTSVYGELVHNYVIQGPYPDFEFYFWEVETKNAQDICLSPEEMNSWLWKFEDGIRAYTPIGKTIISCSAYSSLAYDGSGMHMHVAEVNYGVFNPEPIGL